MKRTKISDIMTKTPITIDEDTSLEAASNLMREKGVRHLPVIDEDGKLIGLVSSHDLLHSHVYTAKNNLDPNGYLPVSLYRKPLYVCTGEDKVYSVAKILTNTKFGALPVVQSIESQKLVGIVSYIDVLKFLLDRDGNQAAPVEAEADLEEPADAVSSGDLPQAYEDALNSDADLSLSLCYLNPYRWEKDERFLIFAKWNDLLFAFGKDDDSDNSVYTIDLEGNIEKRFKGFDEWLANLEESKTFSDG